jgi:putative ABC transport system permease protein
VIEKKVWSVDPDQPLTEIRTMDQWIAAEAAAKRFVLQLIGAFALIALMLATVGVYGVLSYWMRQRTHEIGVRMALGARKHDVLRMVIGQGAELALIGVVVGIGGALGLMRFLSSLLYGVKATDPLTFVAVSLLMTVAALLACYIPARRATKVDPIIALRYE